MNGIKVGNKGGKIVIRQLFFLLAVIIAGGTLVISCSAPAAPPAATSGAAPAAAASASPTSAKEPTINDIFPAGPGRDLILNNCTSCHTYVCVVKGQKTAGHWEQIKTGHRDRVPSLSDADYNTLFTYLGGNFNDIKPEPRLPQELVAQGCPTQ